MATSLPTSSQMDFSGLAIKVTDIDVSGALSTGSQTVTTVTATTVGATTGNFTNIDAGASGTAGTIDIFPTTASKGKTAFTATANTGNTTTTITNAAQATTRTYTIPDAGANASFMMTQGAQTIVGAQTFSASPIIGAGMTIDLDSAPASLTSHAVTLTKYAGVITTEALTTAGGASQAFVLTLTGAAATDLCFVQRAGGTNSATQNFTLSAIMTSNTCTVTVTNNTAATALNGTLIFNLWILKA